MPEDKNQNCDSLKQYRYPFENLVFEGGQNKLIAYCGAVRVLEETGVWSQIVRLGGTGQGAAMAALLAVGYNAKQLESFFSTDLEKIVHDRKLGKCCLGCSSISSGVHPGKAILKWLGSKMKQATGKTNITFEEVLDKYKRELCVVTTNLSQNRAEYCHVKTTPDLSVVEAVRRSMAAPVLHESVESKNGAGGPKEFYAEGGLLCNYPIHCFDGWWLSIQPEDSFLKKISKVEDLPVSLEDSNRFQPLNTKTIGIITIDKSDGSHLPISLSNKLEEYVASDKPTTKLNMNDSKLESAASKSNAEYKRLVDVSTNVNRCLAEMKKNPTDLLTKNELTTIVNNSQISPEDFKLIFGSSKKQQTTDDIFKAVCPKSKKEMKVRELTAYLERKRNWQMDRCTQDQFRPIKNVSQYLEAVNNTMHSGNLQQMLATKPRDVERTVAINLGYIKSWHPNNKMSLADKNYSMEQGVIAMRYFLEQHIRKAPQLKEDADRRSFCRDDFKQYIDDDLSEIIDEKDYMESYLERVL